MQTVLVDTDVAIDYLRGLEFARDLMLKLWKGSSAYFSILSVYELYAGMRDEEEEDTENFITACVIEDVTLDTAKKAGEAYRLNRKKGITLTSIDCLVYATALLKSHRIATRNNDHYPDKRILLPLQIGKGE